MKKILLSIMISGLLLLPSLAGASEFSTLYHVAVEARDSLETFVRHSDKRGEAQLKRIQDSTDAVEVALSRIKVPAGREFGFQLIHEGWIETKKFRENVVSLVLSGREDEALKLMQGQQKQDLFKALVFFDQVDQSVQN
ncbi:MAG: hypothetical protein KUG80_09380 [Gammaproteobacteria bacterium]|nr:hypothetical protein [Gammaproteobacteria bacterium]